MNKFVSQFLLRPAAVAAGLAVLALLAQPARAQVVVSNFVITSDSISFDLSGTLIGSASGDATQLRLVPEQAVSTVAFNDFFAAHSSTLNVGGALLTRIDAQAGNSSIVMFFDQTLETGDTVSGSISASFTAGALQNLDGTTFELDRGYLGGASMIQATGIGAVPVPEPASYAIWAGVLAIATTVIVRRRRPAAVLS